MKGSGCYNCPVKGCTAAYRGSRCANLRELAGVDTDPRTNADRIRAMSDEELADFLDKCEGMGYSDSSVAKDKNGNCVNMLDWLRKPAEED